jgi:hypothetical protein
VRSTSAARTLYHCPTCQPLDPERRATKST